MTKTNTIITIGREFGSGGHEIGAHLAEKLEIPLYDKEMLDRASKDSGIAEEILKAHDEKPTSSFLYSLVMDTYSLGYKTGSYSDINPMPISFRSDAHCFFIRWASDNFLLCFQFFFF